MLAMAGLYEIWRDPTKRRRRPGPVPLDLHGAHHRGRGRRRPHPRPDAADGRAGPVGAPGSTRPLADRDDLLDLLVPAAPGRLEAYPVSTLVSNVRNNGPELVEPLPLEEALVSTGPTATVDTPHGEAAPGDRPGPRSRVATLLLSHGAGGGIDTRDLQALAAPPAAQRRHRGPARAAVAGGRPQGRHPAAPRSTTALVAAAAPAADRAPRWSSAAAPPAPGRRPAAPRRSARPAAWRWRSRCTRPASPEKSPARRAAGRRRTDPGGAGRARHDGPARGVPATDTSTWPSSRAATTASRCRSAGPVSQDEAMEIVVEATLEWLVREVGRGISRRG